MDDDINYAPCRLHCLRAQWRLPDRISKCTRQLVRRPQQALVQSTKMDLRAGLGGHLSSHRVGWVADVGASSPRNSDAVVVAPDGAQIPLAADFLFCPFAWVCSDYHSGAIRRDPGFYRAPVEFGPHLLGTFRALCRLGRI